MLSPGQLASAFAVYWQELERCRASRTYWALLHVTVCVPDICAALESDNGETSRARYVSWADRYLPDQLLSGDERYRMRCKVLHQGRASTGQPGRYTGFSFAQPAFNGQVDHRRIEGTTLILDVGELSKEAQAGAEGWFRTLEAAPISEPAINVERNLSSLVQVRQKLLPQKLNDVFGISIPPVINRTS